MQHDHFDIFAHHGGNSSNFPIGRRQPRNSKMAPASSKNVLLSINEWNQYFKSDASLVFSTDEEFLWEIEKMVAEFPLP